jgi:hypothetical protein
MGFLNLHFGSGKRFSLCLAILAFPTLAYADPYADAVDAGLTNINEESCLGGNCLGEVANTLGAPDFKPGTGNLTLASLGSNGTLGLMFVDELCIVDDDPATPDIIVYEGGGVQHEDFSVDAARVGKGLGGKPVDSIQAQGINRYMRPLDLTAVIDGPGQVDRVQIIDIDNAGDPEEGGQAAGADIDAVECVSSVNFIVGVQLHFANPASNQTQQSFMRVVNTSPATGVVTFSAIDDSGNPAPGGDITFTLGPNESKNFNSLDYEKGNAGKGLTGAFGDGSGKWQFRVSSALDLEVMSLIRTPDGFVTSVTDVVPLSGSDVNEIYFANPKSNQTQQSFIRVVNTSAATGLVTVSGTDDSGNPAPGGDITFTLGPNESKNFNSLDYENGNAAKGLTGALGNGTGKWRMSVTSPLDLEVMSLIRTPDGFVTNLSGVTPTDAQGNHRIYFANPGSNLDQQTFLRIVNTSSLVGTVTISGVDDTGSIAPGGDVQFDLGPFESKNMNAQDLEFGNPQKGLSGALGDGSGRWQLTVSSALSLQVMNLVRTADGFVTNLSRLAPKPSVSTNDVWFVNPGSNTAQRSFLRLVNKTNQTANLTITGIDDAGNAAPGGSITLSIGAFSAKEITAAELENGNAGAGLTGALGDGTGKWRLSVSADADLAVMSLLDTPGGFLTNQSRVLP